MGILHGDLPGLGLLRPDGEVHPQPRRHRRTRYLQGFQLVHVGGAGLPAAFPGAAGACQSVLGLRTVSGQSRRFRQEENVRLYR
ncbi:hypothetical protein D3C81_1948590 [compost metagenome]